MTLPIEQDVSRFRQIVRGAIRQNLRKYISKGELIGRQGKDVVSIPVPQIELPSFRFGEPRGGVGQGEGEPGTPIGQAQPGQGDGAAGDEPGDHLLEAEVTLEELAELLGEELELPRIQPKGKRNLESQVLRYQGLRRVGPAGLRYFKRTYREALKRQLAYGTYNWERPTIIPVHDDMRYRSWKTTLRPENNAVVIYMMDVSGSMTERKKELVRLTTFWIDTWLRAHYPHLAFRYVVHDAAAHEVDAQTFYHLQENGGTCISSAYELCQQIINADYPVNDWNLYAFHFSDGENSGSEDDQRCLRLLHETLLPAVNLFGYGQVQSAGSDLFMNRLEEVKDVKMVRVQINADDDIYAAIKAFLGKGL
jgi:uncharacterized sporulation protein YeaH/YhbH (DUF444 family)